MENHSPPSALAFNVQRDAVQIQESVSMGNIILFIGSSEVPNLASAQAVIEPPLHLATVPSSKVPPDQQIPANPSR